jgi:hypothetical protein
LRLERGLENCANFTPMQLADLLSIKISSVRLWGPDKERALEDEGIVADQGLPDDSILYMTLNDEPIAVTQYEVAK